MYASTRLLDYKKALELILAPKKLQCCACVLGSKQALGSWDTI